MIHSKRLVRTQNIPFLSLLKVRTELGVDERPPELGGHWVEHPTEDGFQSEA